MIKTKISIDLLNPGPKKVLYTVQGDEYSRGVDFAVYKNNVPYDELDSFSASFSFSKEDGTGGSYDQMPDGSVAYSISENIISVLIAPQVLTSPGFVDFSIKLTRDNEVLHAFSIKIFVQQNPGLSYVSENYYKILGSLPDSGWQPNMYLGTDSRGNVVVKVGGGTGGGDSGGGIVFFPSVDKDGNLSWSNNGGLENPETVNISGDPGERGLSMYLLNASVAGSAEYYSFSDFVIPEGYVPKLNDLVLYRSGHLGYIHEVNMELERALVAWIPDANLSGPAGEKGVQGEPGKDGQNGKDGTNGKDGVSVTHSWDGTTLTVTSASGTSSANLKGDKGDQGVRGKPGAKGDTGADGAKGADGKDGYSIFHTSEEATMDDWPFDPRFITTNGRELQPGDKLLTPGGKLFSIYAVSGGIIDASFVSLLKGDTGPAGTTPVKGVDYFTEEEMDELSEVVFVTYDRATNMCSHNFSEIQDLDASGKVVILKTDDGTVFTLQYVDEGVSRCFFANIQFIDGGINIIYATVTEAGRCYEDNYNFVYDAVRFGAEQDIAEEWKAVARANIGAAAADAVKDYSFDPTVYGLPVLQLTGDTSPIAVSKDNKVTLNYVYGDRSGTCTLKGQGATSYKTAQALVNAGKAGKFNYTIKFDTAFEAKTGWGAQQKYCLKANFIDTTHSRNLVSCILWGMSVKARKSVPSQLANLPNGGAVDGFPIVIMLNGEFHGLYTWNIPKDGWMFGLVEDTTKTQAIVGADDHTAATQFKEPSMSGFEVEFVSNEDNADWVNTSITRLISAVMNSNGSDLDTTVAQYLDWDSAIDHYIHTVVDKATDCVDKNYLLVTFDGVKWYMSAYDRDSIHGLNWDASGTTRPVSNVSFVECAEAVRVYELIKRFKTNALKARYKELRGNILSESRIMEKFENFAWAIPSPVMQEDVKLYPTIKGSGVNTIDQIGRFVRQRLVRCDEWINALPAQETPVEPDVPEVMVNLVPTSTDTDGSIYNGTGYKDNARLSSSGGVSSSAQTGSVVTGFIPCTIDSVIRIKGAKWIGNAIGHYYFNLYSSSKTYLDGANTAENGHMAYDATGSAFVYDSTTGVTTINLAQTTWKTGGRTPAYFRINAYGKGADLIVTVNQEITD